MPLFDLWGLGWDKWLNLHFKIYWLQEVVPSTQVKNYGVYAHTMSRSQGLFRASWLHSYNLVFKDLVPVPSALRHNCYFVSAFSSVLHNVRTVLQFSKLEFLAWNRGSLLYGSVNVAPGHVGVLAWSLLMQCWWTRNKSQTQCIHSTYPFNLPKIFTGVN